MGRAVEEGERGDLAEQPDRKRRKRDDDDEEGEPIIPMDVLLLIFARLTAVDLIRSGAACVSWWSAVKTRALQFPPRTIRPWLVLPEDTNAPATDHRIRFLDTNTGKTFSIPLPELHQKRIVGKSDDGFLVYEDELSKRLSMINPVTRETVCFPPLPLRCSRVFVVSSPSPSKEQGTMDTGYTVVTNRADGMLLAFADARNLKTWGRVSSILDDVRVSKFHICGKKFCGLRYLSPRGDNSFYQFFTCDLHDPTDFKIWALKFYCDPWSLSDFGGSFPDHERDEDCEVLNNCHELCCGTFYYPVVLPNGDHIVVCRAVLLHPPRTVMVKVYRMPSDRKKAWIATSIGNYSLFLDDHCSIVMSTLEFPELKPSTIYFNDHCRHIDNAGVGWSPDKDLVMFDLEAQQIGECRSIPMHIRGHIQSTWFAPAF